MFIVNPSLKEFMKSVPICEQMMTMTDLIDLFKHSDRLVIVNSDNYPMGIVKLLNLLPQLITQQMRTELINLAQISEPIEILPADGQLNKFLSSLNKDINKNLVLVNQSGKFLGVIDSWKLLEYLGQNQNQILKFPLDGLIEILEKMPLPLSLQTESGEKIYYNLSWKEQIEQILIPKRKAEETELRVSDQGVNNKYVLDAEHQIILSASLAIKAENSAKLETWLEDQIYPQSMTNSEYKQEKIWNLVKVSLGVKIAYKQEEELWLVLAQDVTEHQQVARELAAKNADLIQLNRLKDEFLACISHELKTPLTSVLGLSSMLKEQMIGNLNERQSRYVKLIHQSGKQLMMVVNDILDLTRMETGQMQLSLDVVNITNVCDRALQQVQEIYLSKNSNQEQVLPNCTLEIHPDLINIIADEKRLKQMLINLLSNAIKFTDSSEKIGLKVNQWDGWIAFTIWDHGIGIPPEKQHLIFQKFQQLENPLTRRFEGTGLGLVLTQRLARLHGGDISFISKPDEGSEFTLLLPPHPPQINEEKFNISYQIKRNRLILIVEAVPQYIENLSDNLSTLGYQIIIARTGTEALEKARRLQPEVILLNPFLPMLSGWDVLTLLKTDNQTKNIPVLITATQGEKDLAYSQGANGFLNMPVQQQELVKVLKKITKKIEKKVEKLTIIHLISEDAQSLSSTYNLPQSSYYQILEVDDLEQADLLAKIWQIDVILLHNYPNENMHIYLQKLSNYQRLASIPIVTMDLATTQAANKIKSLSIFPCLLSNESGEIDALWQVIELAAGISNKPMVGILNIHKIMDLTPVKNHSNDDWLSAFVQYLNKAGFKTVIYSSWLQVKEQMQNKNIDILLIYLTEMLAETSLVHTLKFLGKMQIIPPIVVLDHRGELLQTENNLQLETLLKTVATKIMRSPPISMAEVLDQLHQVINS